MGKLKTLKEKRATVYTQIDELRKAADGREMTAEEQTRWDDMLSDYEKVDKQVEQEERFQDVERRQAEQAYEQRHNTTEPKDGEQEYRSAFSDYLMLGANGISAENRSLFEKRAGITGLNPTSTPKSFFGVFLLKNGGDFILLS